jgi:hypothetical protein
MPRNNAPAERRQFTFHYVEVCPAHAAGANSEQHMSGLQLRQRRLGNLERVPLNRLWLDQHRSLHTSVLACVRRATWPLTLPYTIASCVTIDATFAFATRWKSAKLIRTTSRCVPIVKAI